MELISQNMQSWNQQRGEKTGVQAVGPAATEKGFSLRSSIIVWVSGLYHGSESEWADGRLPLIPSGGTRRIRLEVKVCKWKKIGQIIYQIRLCKVGLSSLVPTS